MVRKSILNITFRDFSENSLLWVSTLIFLPFIFFFRFIIGTSLVLDKSYPAISRTYLILGLVFVFWLIWKWIFDDRFLTTGLEKYLGFFYLTACLSTAFSVNPSLSLEKLIGISAYLLGTYLLIDLKRFPILWQGLINALLITAGLSSLLILITAFPWLKLYQLTLIDSLTNPVYLLKVIPRLPYSLGLHPSITAGYLVMVLPLGFYQFFKSKKTFWKILLLLGSLLNLVILILTQSRGGLLGLVCLLLVFIILFRKKIWNFILKNKILGLSATIALSLSGIGYILLLWRSRGFNLNSNNFQTRFHLWNSAFKIIKEHPWFGSGLGTFGQEYLKLRDPNIVVKTVIHAHNQLLQITTELGIIGLVSLLIVVWQGFRLLGLRSENKNPASLVSLIALGGLFGVLTPDAILTSSMIVLMFIFYLVWILPSQNNNPLPDKKRTFSLLTFSVVVIGLGCGWITWKIQPYGQALLAVEEQNWHQVSQELSIALDRDHNNPYLHHALGFSTGQEACQTGEGFADPISYYQQALQTYSGWGIDHANLAVLYAANEDYKNAAVQMELAVQNDPRQSFYSCLLGDYYLETGRLNDALGSFGKCIANGPQHLDTPYWQEDKSRRELIPDVIKIAENSFNENDSQTRMLKYAKLSVAANEFEQANRYIQEFLTINNLDLGGNLLYFRILNSAGKLLLAEEKIDQLLILYPRIASLWTYKGLIAALQDDIKTAEHAFVLSDRLNPSVYNTWMLADFYHSQGKLEPALNLYQKALSPVLPSDDFSRDVAGRWPIKGIFIDCMPLSRTNHDYFLPALKAANNLEDQDCNQAACIYQQLLLDNPTTTISQQLLDDLPCKTEIDPGNCFQMDGQ